ncbi:site-specific integrase, partial [Bacillus cereus]
VQVKRPRETMVLDDQKLWEVYYAHMAQLEKIKRKFKDKDTGALFISKKSGLPISGTGYAKKFVKIKERFLAKLIANNRYEDIEFLTSAEWSTHIGRGVYTNFLIDLGLSIEEIANLRGD